MRILLVEDEEKVSNFIARGLEAERFAVDAVGDGASGLEMARTYAYDLIILDLMMPGMSGTDVLYHLRNFNSQVPILILTARDAVTDKVQNLEAGADDYLTKPFAFAELLARARALIRRGAVNRSNTLRVRDLELDRILQQVKRAGRRIELTSKEYGLLEYLMANAEETSETLAIAIEEVDRLTKIVESLLAISRLDAGEARMERSPIDMGELVATTADQMWLLAEDKNIMLRCEAQEAVAVEGDPARLKQVIVNLLDNAIKYTAAGGSVVVSVRTENRNAVGEVKDDGAGIPADALPHLFGRFYRVDKARSRHLGGAGLGLWTKADSVTYFDDLRVIAK